MELEAIILGTLISLIAFYVNRKVTKRHSKPLMLWNGWVAASTFRFLAIIFTGIYLFITTSLRKEPVNEIIFMANVLVIVFFELLLDLYLSLLKIKKSEINERVNHV